MIDLHSHVLPSLDDGPADISGALALARVAVAAGTRVIAATPHIGLRYPVVPDELPERIASLRARLADEGIQLEIVGGGELAPTAVADLGDDELRAITLGGGTCILLECPFTRAAGLMPALVEHLQRRGFRVLLAHPERSPEFLRDPAGLSALIRGGAMVQVTASAFRGDFGRTARRFALELLDAGLVHVVASDAHDARDRSPVVLPLVRDAVRRQGLPTTTIEYLTAEAPQALLEDAPLPPPSPRRTRPLRARLRALSHPRSAS
jgi:protein-tyrosine phosphatase